MCIFGEKLDETALNKLPEFDFAVHCVCVKYLEYRSLDTMHIYQCET